MNKDERLEAFEKMLQNVRERYSDTVAKIDALKAKGKTKTVTYNQLLAEKLSLQKILSMYEIYGILESDSGDANSPLSSTACP